MIDNFSKTLSVTDRRGEDHNLSFPLREGEIWAFLKILFCFVVVVFNAEGKLPFENG